MPELDITDASFTLDGEPFQIISGALHYFRVHPDQWRDRLDKARLMGLNTVDTYVPWNLHQPRAETFRMDGGIDLPAFLDLARELGLFVLLRPGPYICAEWDGGGLPGWLQSDPDIRLRSTDSRFMDAVDRYFEQLWPPLLSRLASQGGPVLAVQLENEYGAFGEDTKYLTELADLLRQHGVDVPLFTCDQPDDLDRGGVPGVLRTVNFGSGAADKLPILRQRQPQGPLMCTEFWNGWFDHWGAHHVTRDAEDAAGELDDLLSAGASVNLYMFHGGTNFGFTSGANDKGIYQPTVTSYDYDSPLSEAGDPTPKYRAFREVIARHAPVPDEPVPEPSPKLGLPAIDLPEHAALLSNLTALSTPQRADRPLTMERLGQSSGFTLYQTSIAETGPVLLEATGIGDRAQVFLDGQPVGILDREHRQYALAFHASASSSTLTLLVENQGRVNYGPAIHDPKGIIGTVTVNGVAPAEWTHYPLPLDDLGELAFGPTTTTPVGPTFYRGAFQLNETADTFVALEGWTKGNVWINGFHLGRYWSRGPQRTLYVPRPVLRQGGNEVVVLELHATRRPSIALRERPDLGPSEP